MLQYTHRPHPRAKSIKLSLEADGTLIVSSPKRTSINRIEKFIKEKESWIKAQQKKIKENSFHVVTNDRVWLFGQPLDKKVIVTPNKKGVKFEIKQEGKTLIIQTTNCNNSKKSQLSEKLNKFLKAKARAYFEPKTKHLSKKMSVDYNRIYLREQKTRWGSCSSKKNLNFNWRLVHFETLLIDYVIIHELAHLRHRNHSAEFWELVNQFDPDYKTHRDWLKRHPVVIS